PRKRERSVVREDHSLYVGDMNDFPLTFQRVAPTGRRRVRLYDPSNLNIVLSHVSCSDRSRGERKFSQRRLPWHASPCTRDYFIFFGVLQRSLVPSFEA